MKGKKYNIGLLDNQITIILKSLEYYCYTSRYMYSHNEKIKSFEENAIISLITDTYHQITAQLREDTKEQKNKFKKIA